MTEPSTLTFEFPSPDARDRFLTWFRDAGGETDWREFSEVNEVDPAHRIRELRR